MNWLIVRETAVDVFDPTKFGDGVATEDGNEAAAEDGLFFGEVRGKC
jgi:hypothetical protein